MKYILSLSLLLFTAINCMAQLTDANVRDCFDQYKAAIVQDRPDDAVQYLDASTVAYFEEIVALAQSASGSDLSAHSMVDQMMVLSVRSTTPKEIILADDSQAIMSYMVSSGLIGKKTIDKTTIGDVNLTGDKATAVLHTGGTSLGLALNFTQEKGLTKLGLSSLFPSLQQTMTALHRASGLQESAYVLFAMQTLLGIKADESAWEPILR